MQLARCSSYGDAMTHDEHGLILRHFTDWATKKQRAVDAGLVGELLELRASYDELEPTYWPTGSVEHLLLERWPAKGPMEVPAADVLVETLDGWFRFLRSTGRMSARSAEVKDLVRETRRAAPRMQAVGDDRASWSTGKTLMEFGRSIGLGLDETSDQEGIQQRLDEISRRWNELPVEERRRLMPDPGGAPDLSLAERLTRRFGVDDAVQALLLDFADRLPTGELPTAEEIAPAVRTADYFHQVLALRDWIGAGRPLTDTDVLRPASAREAHEILGLGEWTRAQLRRLYPDERLPGVAAVGLDVWIEREATRPWRSAAECEALHRLWFGVHGAGLVEHRGRKVVAKDWVEQDDEDLVNHWLRAVVGLFNLMESGSPRFAVIVQALMTSYVGGRSPVSKADLLDFHDAWIMPPSHRRPDDVSDRLFAPSVEHAIGQVADTGLLVEDRESVTLTPAGDVFVTAWLRHLEQRDG